MTDEITFNAQFLLVFVFTLLVMCVPYLIYSRLYFHFGKHITNELNMGNFENFYMRKVLKKKIEQISAYLRSFVKFKRFVNEKDEENKNYNYADRRLRDIVDEYINKQKRKSVIAIEQRIPFKRNEHDEKDINVTSCAFKMKKKDLKMIIETDRNKEEE